MFLDSGQSFEAVSKFQSLSARAFVRVQCVLRSCVSTVYSFSAATTLGQASIGRLEEKRRRRLVTLKLLNDRTQQKEWEGR